MGGIAILAWGAQCLFGRAGRSTGVHTWQYGQVCAMRVPICAGEYNHIPQALEQKIRGFLNHVKFLEPAIYLGKLFSVVRLVYFIKTNYTINGSFGNPWGQMGAPHF